MSWSPSRSPRSSTPATTTSSTGCGCRPTSTASPTRSAGANNLETGWGLAGETFRAMDALDRYRVPTWFRLGDRDLATHLYRTERRRRRRVAERGHRRGRRGVGAGGPAPPDERRPGRAPGSRSSAPTGRPRNSPCRNGSCASTPSSPVRAVRFAGARDGPPGPRGTRGDRRRRHDPDLSEQPGDLDRSGPRRPRGPGRARRRGATGWWRSAPHRRPSGPTGPPTGSWARSGSRSVCVGVAEAYRDVCGTLVIDTADANDRARGSRRSGCGPSSPTR